MTDDLVDQLRAVSRYESVGRTTALALMDTADEVERFRAEREIRDAEIDRLHRWKAEAIEVIARWDEVWERLGGPGPLGKSKALAVAAEVDRLLAQRRAVLDLHTPCDDPDGCHSCEGTARCLECGDAYPCPTVRALLEEES